MSAPALLQRCNNIVVNDYNTLSADHGAVTKQHGTPDTSHPGGSTPPTRRPRGPHRHHAKRAPSPPITDAQRMRASLARLPRWTQPSWTWLTGLALPLEEPLMRWTPLGRTIMTLCVLVVAVAAAGTAATAGGAWWLAYPPAALIVVGRLRWLYIVGGHFATHGTFVKVRNALAGDIATSLTFTQPFATYEREHARFHHSKRLGTAQDPDSKFIAGLGFLPGTALRVLRRRLLFTVLSPAFHWQMLWSRLKANLTAGKAARRLAPFVLLTLFSTVAVRLDLLTGFAFGWLLPLTFGYNISALLQFMSEHRWFRLRQAGESPRTHNAKLTFGRFLGDALPQEGGPSGAIWLVRLLFLHLPARVAVLVGDLPQHDLHHLRPKGDWANAAFTRRDLIEKLGDKWPRGQDDEIHGSLFRMLDEVLSGLSEREPLRPEEREELHRPPR